MIIKTIEIIIVIIMIIRIDNIVGITIALSETIILL